MSIRTFIRFMFGEKTVCFIRDTPFIYTLDLLVKANCHRLQRKFFEVGYKRHL